MHYYAGHKLVKQVEENAIDSQSNVVASAGVIDKKAVVLPLIDRRDIKNIDIAFSAPLAEVLSKLFVEKAKKKNIFNKGIDMATDDLYYKKQFRLDENAIKNIKSKSEADLIVWGDIEEFTGRFEATKYYSQMENENKRPEYNVSFSVKGDIKYIFSGENRVEVIKFNFKKAYPILMGQIYSAKIGDLIINSVSLSYLNRSQFDTLANIFLSDAVNSVMDSITNNKTISEAFEYKEADHFYYPADNRVLSINKKQSFEMERMLISLGMCVAGAVIGDVIGTSSYSKNKGSSVDEIGSEIVGLYYGIIGSAIGGGISFIVTPMIINSQVERDSVYAKNSSMNQKLYNAGVGIKVYIW
jgi:hypothetical protein